MSSSKMRAAWKQTVISRLVEKGAVSCQSKIENVLECGTAVLKCGQQVKSNISLFQFTSLHAF